MAIFTINYDLRAPGRDYLPLYEGIRQIDPDACWVQGSLWFVTSAHSALVLTVFLRGLIDPNDTVLVAEITDNWFSSNLPPHARQWLGLRNPQALFLTEAEAYQQAIAELEQRALGAGTRMLR